MKVNGFLRDLQVLSFIGEAGLEPRQVGLEVEVRQIEGVKALPPPAGTLALDFGPGASRTSEVVDGVKSSRL